MAAKPRKQKMTTEQIRERIRRNRALREMPLEQLLGGLVETFGGGGTSEQKAAFAAGLQSLALAPSPHGAEEIGDGRE